MDVLSSKQPVRVALAAALVASAVIAVSQSRSAAAGVPCQRTFSSSSSATITPATELSGFPYRSPGGASSQVTVVPTGVVADIDVAVHITHPAVANVQVAISHSGSPFLKLKDSSLATGANLAGTVFDDEAADPITVGTPPYSGRFRPASPLSAFDGTNAGGVWTLSVTNFDYAGGTLDSWSVTVTYSGTCDYDGDAVEDHADQCLGTSAHTATGCPLTTRSLSAKYRHEKFKGTVSSPVAGCAAGRVVTIWKVHSGPDRTIGTKTTASDGSYRLKRAKHPGRYYATSPQAAVTDVAECPAVTSPRFRIR